MTQRLSFPATAPAGYRAVYGLSEYVKANVEHRLMWLIELRASIINGCTFCVDMHSRDALADGEDARRLFAVGAWEDAPFFDERERAALASPTPSPGWPTTAACPTRCGTRPRSTSPRRSWPTSW